MRTIESRPRLALAIFAMFYLAVTLVASRLKPFWYDELATYYISRLPDWNTIFTALAAGADLNPPTLYFFTRISHTLLGANEVSTRLPATLGFLVLLLSIYSFLVPRVGRPIAFAAMAFPTVTGAYNYAFEARPYGLMLGCLGLALLAWQRNKPLLLGAILWLAVTTHAYSFLAIGPFLLAELVTWRRTGKPRWQYLVALAFPFTALAMYIPLLGNHNKVLLENDTFRPGLDSLPHFFHTILNPTLFPLLIVLAFAIWTARPTEQTESATQEDLALTAGFLLIPIAAILLATGVTRIFFDRYGLPGVIGLTFLFAWLMARLNSRQAPALATILFAIWTVASVVPYDALKSAMRSNWQPDPPLESIRPDLPAVISNGISFLPIAHYAPKTFSDRLHFLLDREAAVQFTGSDALDVAYPIMKKWYQFPGHIDLYKEFLARRQPFLLIGPSTNTLDWLTKKLLADGATVKILAIRKETTICEVTPR